MKTGKTLVAKSREAQHPQKRKAGPVAKPTPKTAEEAHRAIIATVFDYDTVADASLAVGPSVRPAGPSGGLWRPEGHERTD